MSPRGGSGGSRGGPRGGSRGGRTQRGTRADRVANAADRRSVRPEGLGGDVVEGRNAVFELLDAGTRRVRDLWVADDLADAEALEVIVNLAMELGVPVKRVSNDQLRKAASSEAPQGVLAHAAPVDEADLDALLETPDAFLVALDGVTDPGNLGAVMRSACAAGAHGVIIPKQRSARLTPSAVKAAAGAVEHLPVARAAGIPQTLDRAKRAGVWTVGLDADGDTSIFDVAVADQPVLLVMGAEGRGLARLVRERCDVVAHIPMTGAMESINVSAAAAIACFEVQRRRSAG